MKYKPFHRLPNFKPLPDRITHDRLIDMGFEFKMNIYSLNGISVQKLNSCDSTWRASKGMTEEENLNDINDLLKFILKHS